MPMSIARRGLWAAPIVVLGLSATAHAGDLSVVGTGDGIDLLRALGAAYTADHPETNVVVPPSIGSGGGVAAVGSDKEVLARIARPLSDTEKEAGLVATPVFRLPSAFFVHRSAGVAGVTSAQLADIYRGKITNWREVGGADVRIKVVRREDQDSTLLVLRQSMPGWKDLVITEKSKMAVTTQDGIDTVKEVQGAIGFGPFTKALEMELAVLKVDARYPTDRDYPSAVTLSFVHKPVDRHARRQAVHQLCESREGQDGPDANGRCSGRRVTAGQHREDEVLLRLSSLSTRLIIAVVATATVAFAASFGLTIVRLDQGLERQAEQLARLSEEKLGQRMDGEARLAGARLDALSTTAAARLESMAQRADVVKAISSANVVAISELLGRAAQAADIDGILVVDTKLRVFGAASDKVDIVAANRAIQDSALAQDILSILGENDRRRPRVMRRTIALTEDRRPGLGCCGDRAAGIRRRRADLR